MVDLLCANGQAQHQPRRMADPNADDDSSSSDDALDICPLVVTDEYIEERRAYEVRMSAFLETSGQVRAFPSSPPARRSGPCGIFRTSLGGLQLAWPCRCEYRRSHAAPPTRSCCQLMACVAGRCGLSGETNSDRYVKLDPHCLLVQSVVRPGWRSLPAQYHPRLTLAETSRPVCCIV